MINGFASNDKVERVRVYVPPELKWKFILPHLLAIVHPEVRLALTSRSSDVRKIWISPNAKAFGCSAREREAQQNFCVDALRFTRLMGRFPSIYFANVRILKIYLPASQIRIIELAGVFRGLNIVDLTVICGHNHNFMEDALMIWASYLHKLLFLRLEFNCSRQDWERLSPNDYDRAVAPIRLRPHPPYPWSMDTWHTTLSNLSQLHVLVLYTPLVLSDDLDLQDCPITLGAMVEKWASGAPFLRRIYLLYAGDEWYGHDFYVDGNMGFAYRLTRAHFGTWAAEDILPCLDSAPGTDEFQRGVLPGDESLLSFP
ncbi:hypothetical protein BDN70DRAFT_901831 [Pholiota conissans]|uniref:Uncharacterized protein n=1 Tax=Pholiota conissans TaxID=109636 RepID=A0A9P5YKK0_9AGAR|nr:hypothetical protein BDN70DRAFT_901831 [Pholiota conissans]